MAKQIDTQTDRKIKVDGLISGNIDKEKDSWITLNKS